MSGWPTGTWSFTRTQGDRSLKPSWLPGLHGNVANVISVWVLATTNVAATAGAVAGVNDNVQETRNATGEADRRGAVFSGVQGALQFRFVGSRGDFLGVNLDGRELFNRRFDGASSDTNGSLGGSLLGTFRLGKFTSLNLSGASRISQAVASRAADGVLLFDPLVQNTTFWASDVTALVTHELSPRWRLLASGAMSVSTVLEAPPLLLADGLELDRRGLDGITISGRAGVAHDWSARTSVDLSVTYRRILSPYSTDTNFIPPRIAGPQATNQVVLDAGYLRTLSERWVSQSRLGLSLSDTTTFDRDQRLSVFPVGSQYFNYVDERFFGSVGANVSYGALVPRLGTGPLLTATATAAGQPFVRGWTKKVVMVFNGTAVYSSTSTPGGDHAVTRGLGAGVEARYPIYQWLGLHVGYDLYLSSSFTGKNPTVDTYRNMLYAGLSGFWTTDTLIQPLATRVLPK